MLNNKTLKIITLCAKKDSLKNMSHETEAHCTPEKKLKDCKKMVFVYECSIYWVFICYSELSQFSLSV